MWKFDTLPWVIHCVDMLKEVLGYSNDGEGATRSQANYTHWDEQSIASVYGRLAIGHLLIWHGLVKPVKHHFNKDKASSKVQGHTTKKWVANNCNLSHV